MQVLECGGPGGTGNQVAAIVRGLEKSRFETTLVYNVRPGASDEEFRRFASGADHYVRIPEMTREISPAKDLSAWRKLYRLFRESRPDVVHAHSSKAGVLARTAALAAGVPRIFYSPRGYAFLQLDRSALSRGFYRMVEASVSWIGEIAACSESEAALARSLLTPRRVHVVRDAYLGAIIDHEPSDISAPTAYGSSTPNGHASPSNTAPLTVCAAGRLSFPRNPEAFVRLASRLLSARKDVRCLWIGDGELGQKVRSLAKEYGLNERFEISGWLTHEEALKRLRSCDVFVHYSRWEGLPNAVLDAFACGLPVVASDISGNRNVVRPGENGWIARDEDLLFTRVSELLDTPERRAEFGSRGLAMVRSEYSLDSLLSELSSLYLGPKQ
jgi:glycosyltransferase involved in cell wall biosynthesis